MLVPAKIIVRWDFAHKLQFYQSMLAIGPELNKEFPHWQRGPFTLELFDKELRNRTYLSSNAEFFEWDGPPGGLQSHL